MKRDFAIVAFFSLILIAVGEWLAQAGYLSPAASDKGDAIDRAFRVLVMYAVPVFSVVIVTLVYSILRYRVRGEPVSDGPAQYGRGVVPVIWVGVTAALCLLLIVYPGLTELPNIIGNPSNPDLLVKVDGRQWSWTVTYPAYSLEVHDELVLPINRQVQFQLTSADVIHDFWIPAFRMHMDMVPGQTTYVSLRPTRLGTTADDSELRLQCSQLCGLGHSVMAMPVRVVSDADFSAWLVQRGAKNTASVTAAAPDASASGARSQVAGPTDNRGSAQ